MRKIYFVVAIALFAGCASKDLGYEPRDLRGVREFNASKAVEFSPELGELINLTLKNNEDIRTAALNLSQAMSRAGLSQSDFWPSASLSAKASSSRDISAQDTWKKGFNSAFKLSYELDIYGKIFDNAQSKKWLALGAELNLANLRESMVSAVIDEYFHILFLNDKIALLELNSANLETLGKIVNLKSENGKQDPLECLQIEQSSLKAQNEILNARRDLNSSYEKLKNLTRSDKIIVGGISDVKLSQTENINLDELGEKIILRPDVNSALAALNSAFYDYRAAQKSFYPSVSLSGSLSDSDAKFSRSFGFNILSTDLQISLPFLDYSRLKSNLKISEDEFNKLRLKYEKMLNNALNEAIKYANFYAISKENYANSAKIAENSDKIVQIYNQKYALGRLELKKLLEAKNDLISAKIALLSQKYLLISEKIAFFRAIAE